ncbi:hypothetical protein [Microbacterium album]|uniref:Uncharacterized protein n=1 Tax=Microbacterium album TaxID=2053191 RepID=A0A917IDD5_9MICO|nr:hypothetical protein [Microbacterium album]GGH41133.1 hypothetical protein GCM10010921_13490 [Microbacterium album]
MAGQPRTKTWTGIAILAVLAVVVAVLIVLAMQRVARDPGAAPMPPATGIGTESPTPTTTPTPTVTAPPVVARDDERLLAVGAGGVLWRAVAGSCEAGVEPLLERSVDDGVTWTDVTPRYRGITQIMSLAPFAADQAEMVATIADGADPCATRAMRTFSGGEFWSDYDDVLAASTFLAFDRSAVVAPGAELPVPCAEPRSFQRAGDLIAAVCDGDAVVWDGASWQPAGPADVVAVAGEGGAFVALHAAADCEGLAVSVVAETGASGVPVCSPDLSPAAPTAVALTDGGVTVWHGDEVVTVAMPTS